MSKGKSPGKPKPVVSDIEFSVIRDGEPAWMPASGRPGFEFPRELIPREMQSTLRRIAHGGPMPFPKDGSIHHNYARDLPEGHRYREVTSTGNGNPRSANHGCEARGRRRLVIADDGELYITLTHYDRSPKQRLTRAQKEVLRDHIPLEWQNGMYRVQVHPALKRRLKARMAEWDRKDGLAPVRRPAGAAKRSTKGPAMPSSKPPPPPLTPTFNQHASGNPPPATTSPKPVNKPESAPPSPGPTINGSAPPTASPSRTTNVKPPEKQQTLTQNFNRQSRGIKP